MKKKKETKKKQDQRREEREESNRIYEEQSVNRWNKGENREKPKKETKNKKVTDQIQRGRGKHLNIRIEKVLMKSDGINGENRKKTNKETKNKT